MLERLAAWVLNAYLGEYLEDLNTDQLSIGLLKGAVELEGLPLKKDALRKLDLPLEVKSGFVGKISLSIPLTGFASQPWVINMDRLYVVAGPAQPEVDEAAKIARQQERKAKMLSELETLWQAERKLQAGSPSSSSSYWLSFGSSLVYNVVENLQLIVSNVHIRYEDVLSTSQQYAFGIVIHRLSAQSTDENWVPKFVSCSSNSLMRKLVDLNELSIYWATDVMHYAHLGQRDIVEMLERGVEMCRETGREKKPQHVLEPVSGRVRLVRNTSSLPLRSQHSPRIRLEASFNQFNLALEESQYRGLLSLLKEFERYEKRKHNSYPRPMSKVRDSVRSWWTFAQLNVLHTIKEKNERRTPSFLSKRCKDCCAYVKLYKGYLNAQRLTASMQSHKSAIEQEFTFNEIKILREAAIDHLKAEGLWFPSPGATATAVSAKSTRPADAQLSTQPSLKQPPPVQPLQGGPSSSSSSATQVGRLFSWAWSKLSSASPPGSSVELPLPPSPPVCHPEAAALPVEVGEHAMAEGRIKLTEAEKLQLEQEIQDVLGEVQQESDGLLARDAVFAELNFTLGSGSLALRFNDGDTGGTVKLVCNGIKAGLTSQPRTHSATFSLSLGGMYVRDLYNKNTIFPDLVSPRGWGLQPRQQSHDQPSSEQQLGGTHLHMSPNSDDNSALFCLKYELRPSDVTADHRLYVQTKPLDIVYNEAVVRRVKEFFIPRRRPIPGAVFGSELDLAAKALQRYEELRDRTKMDIQATLTKLLDGEQAMVTARRWQVSLDIAAPQIIIPRSWSNTDETAVVFDLGRIQMDNVSPRGNEWQLLGRNSPANLTSANADRVLLSQHSSLYFDSEENFVTPCSTPPVGEDADSAEPGSSEEEEATKVLTGSQSGATAAAELRAMMGPHAACQLQNAAAASSLASSLYDRVYERYTLKLSDAQVIVGVLHHDGVWQQASQRGSSSLHVLDKFTLAVQFDRRLVLASDPRYPAVKLSGCIDLLKAHLTEAKVQALSSCADMLLGSTAPAHRPQRHRLTAVHLPNASLLRTPATERKHQVTRGLLEESKLTVLDFVVKELSVDIQSRGRCVAELKVSEAVASCSRKPSELQLSFTVQTLLLVDALQTYGHDFELLVASHRDVGLDSKSGSLLASQVGSPVCPSSPPPATSPPMPFVPSPGEPAVAAAGMPQAGGTLVAFQTALVSRMHKLLSPMAAARGSSSENEAEPGIQRFLAQGTVSRSHNEAVPEPCHDPLITVNYRKVLGRSHSSEHSIGVRFNSLDLVANQGTIVELLHFFRAALPQAAANRVSAETAGATAESNASADPVRVTADFSRLNILLMYTTEHMQKKVAHKIATATLSQSKVSITLGNCAIVEGHIGGLQMVDVTKDGRHSRIFTVGHDPLHPASNDASTTSLEGHDSSSEVGCSDAFYFYYHDVTKSHATSIGNSTARKQCDCQVQNDSCLQVKLGSVKYLHSPEFLRSLTLCAQEFKGYLNRLATSLKTAASDIAMSIVKKHTQLPAAQSHSGASSTSLQRQLSSTNEQGPDGTSRTHHDQESLGFLRLDVVLDTPVIMVPRVAGSDDLLVAHLGRMSVSNTRTVKLAHSSSAEVVDSALIAITHIRLFTSVFGKASEFQKFVINDAAIELTVDYHHSQGTSKEVGSTDAVPEFVLNGEEEEAMSHSNLVVIKADVKRGMQVVLSRSVCEQIGETVSGITHSQNVPHDANFIPTLPETLLKPDPFPSVGICIAAHPEASLSALKLDGICELAAEASGSCVPGVGLHDVGNDGRFIEEYLQVKATLAIDALQIAVRGDLGNACETDIVRIAFSNFRLSAEKMEPHLTAVELRLHALHIYDLLQPSNSMHRLLVDSRANNFEADRCKGSKQSFLSMSCPYPVPLQRPEPVLPSSFPAMFQSKHLIKGNLHLCQQLARLKDHRDRCLCTPLSCPANERSDGEGLESEQSESSDSSLVNISILLIDPQCARFKSDFDEVTCIASITFNCLELVVNLDTWVVLLDFFGIGAKVFSDTAAESTACVDLHADSLRGEKAKVNLRVSSLAVVLNKPGYELARASVQGLSTVIVKSDDSMHLKGTLDKISLVDLSPRGQLYPEKFVTVGESALSFDILKYAKPDACLSRDFDVGVMLDMSSVCYTHTKRFQCELLNYFQDFNDQYDALGHMRAAAAGQKVPVLGGRSPRISLRINAATPIILLPQCSTSGNVLIVNLGNLLVENRFLFAGQKDTLGCASKATEHNREQQTTETRKTDVAANCMTQSVIGSLEDDSRHTQLVRWAEVLFGESSPVTPGIVGDDHCCLLDVMSIVLSEMDLYSGLRSSIAGQSTSASTSATDAPEVGAAAESEAIVFRGYAVKKEANHPLKEKCMLKLQVERNLDNDMSHNSPELALHGTLSSVCCTIDASQYKLVHNILDHNLGEDMPDLVRLRKQDPQIQTVLSGTVYRTIFFTLDMHNVSVELFYRSDEADSHTCQPLAKLNFIKSQLTFEGFSNQSKNIDLVSQEIRIVDTRYRDSTANTRPNRFVSILQPTTGKQESPAILQAEVHYHSSSDDPARVTVLLNNMRVMVIVDWWMALKHFFSPSADSAALLGLAEQQLGASKPPVVSGTYKKNDLPLQLKLNLTDTELVLIEDASTPDTDAVIFRATVIMQYSPAVSTYSERLLSCTLHGIELFSCCLAAEDSSAMSIIDPLDLFLELCRNESCGLVQPRELSLPQLEVSMTNLNVRLSYNDLLLFRAIARPFMHACNAKNPQFCTADPALTLVSKSSQDATVNMHSPDPVDTTLFASVDIKVDMICICFIDDCGSVDIPLAEMRLRDCSFSQHMYSQFGGEASFSLHADCYNRALSGWEPLIEPWKCGVSWSMNLLGDNTVSIKVKSEHVLNVSMTNNFLEMMRTTQKTWMYDYSRQLAANQKRQSSRTRTVFTPYSLRNSSGCTMWLMPYVTDGHITTETAIPTCGNDGSNQPWMQVEHEEEASIVFAEKDKLRHQSTHELRTRQLRVKIDGYKEASPINVDAIGTYYRIVRPAGHNSPLPPARVIFHINLEKNAFKVITVRSSLVLINNLSESVEVKLESLVQDGFAKSLQLNAGQWMPVPLRLACCRVWIRPAFWDLPFCTQPVEWHKGVLVREETVTESSSACNGPRVCSAKLPQQGCYRFCVSTRKDDYPESKVAHVTLADGQVCEQPGHTIMLLPSLTLVNLLPMELAYKIRGSEACGKIPSGSKACVFTANVASALELGITLENYPTCRELVIPPGTTEYKCKMKLSDVKNRALYIQAYVRSTKGGGSLKVSFSAPYWMVNRSGLPLVFRQDGTRLETAGQFDEHEMARSVAPLPFCFPDREAASLCIVRVGKSVHGAGTLPQWCHRFVLESGVTVRSLHVTPSDNRPDWVYNIGIEVRQGTAKYADTSFVTFAPRFQLSNQSSYKLVFSQRHGVLQDGCDYMYLTALPKSSLAFHWPRVDFDQLLCTKVLEDQNLWHWSGGFRIDAVNSFYINIRGQNGAAMFLHVEVALQGATYVVVFADASHLPPPLRIDNMTEVSIRFWQTNSGDERLKTIVRPHSSVAYAWDEPTLEPQLTCTVLGSGAATLGNYNMDSISEGQQLQYENFIYIAFSSTFDRNKSTWDTMASCQELVLDVVNGNQVILSRKEVGKRSQLWRMTSSGMIEHEGSAAPRDLRSRGSTLASTSLTGYVLDIADIAVLPNNLSQALTLQKPNPRRQTTQRWMFTEGGRLVCGADGRCVQTAELRAGARAVLGPSASTALLDTASAAMMNVEAQRMLPGSGVISVNVMPDGPTRVLRLVDFHRRSNPCPKADQPLISRDVVSRDHETTAVRSDEQCAQKNIKLMCILPGGIGISIVNSVPEELAYMSLTGIYLELTKSAVGLQLETKVSNLQVDNQLLSSPRPVMLCVTPSTKKSSEDSIPAFFMSFHKLPSKHCHCCVFKHMAVTIKPVTLQAEEVLLWKLVAFFGLGQSPATGPAKINELESEMQRKAIAMPLARRYYFEVLRIVARQICLSMTTASNLSPELKALKRRTGIPLISFEDAKIELDPFVQKYLFETQEFLINVVLTHFKEEVQRQAGKILGSVNFLGNPLGLFNDMANGLNSLIVDGNVGGLVKNMAHGASDSLAKVAGTLAQGIGRLALDDEHERSRAAYRQRHREDGMVAGFLGLSHGLFGGLTSLVSQTYDGAVRGGVEGMFAGLARGAVGTVTKPVAGILDFASGAASAVRDTSRGQQRMLGQRAREPRCCCGAGTAATSRLLQPYREDRALAQKDLYQLVSTYSRGGQGPGTSERLVDLVQLQKRSDSDGLALSCLVTDSGLYIINGAMTANSISLSVKYSDLLSCTCVQRPTAGGSSGVKSRCYIEVRIRCDSTSGPPPVAAEDAVRSRAPQIRCDSPSVCQLAVSTILLAKAQHDERLYAVVPSIDLPTPSDTTTP